MESNRFIFLFTNFSPEFQQESYKCIPHQCGKVAKKCRRVIKIQQKLSSAQREVQCRVYIHAPRTLSTLQRSTHAQEALAALELSPSLFWADTGKSSTAQPDSCWAGLGKHARSAHKTIGNSILVERQRQIKINTSQKWKIRRNCCKSLKYSELSSKKERWNWKWK